MASVARMLLTPADMVKLGVGLADELVITTRRSSGKPENEAHVLVIERPEGERVAKQRVDV